ASSQRVMAIPAEKDDSDGASQRYKVQRTKCEVQSFIVRSLGLVRAMITQPYAELAELAGGFIHEIKNRLSTLGLNLQLLAEDFQEPQSPRERRALDRVLRLQTECQRLVDISNDFLRFARVQDLELEPCNLNEVVEEMIDFFAPTARQ